MKSLFEDLEQMIVSVCILVLDELLKQQILETIVNHLTIRRLATTRILDTNGVVIMTIEPENDYVTYGEGQVKVISSLQTHA